VRRSIERRLPTGFSHLRDATMQARAPVSMMAERGLRGFTVL
jgi:hypothetical protein